MVILMAHNFYQQPGGEDYSFASEAAVLEAGGHRVLRYTARNDDLRGRSRVGAAADTVWNRKTVRQLRALFRENAVEIAHFQNTFPIISPAAYYAARSEGVPVVQSLRNYRLLCPNALFYRNDRVCEDCLSTAVPWPGVLHACYRGSRAASAVVATMLTVHRLASTWTSAVDMYIASTEFSKQKFVQGGLPADRIAVKPNFVFPDPGPGPGLGGYALFVGRLSEEKGIDTLLAAWRRVGERLPLKIVGAGPMQQQVEEATRCIPGVEWLGSQSPAEVYQLMGAAGVLIFPSQWYETFGRTIAESFAKGTPVIASYLGGMTTMIEHGRTGFHFRAGDSDDLAAQVEAFLAQADNLQRMRREARAEFEAHYTAERNYRVLMDVYATARRRAGKHHIA